MPDQLIKVQHSNGEAKSLNLDTGAMLDAIRKELTGPGIAFMQEADSFLHDNSQVARDHEGKTALESVLGDGEVLHIGAPDGLLPEDGVDRYVKLNDAQKRQLLNAIQLRRGMIVNDDGLEKSFADVYDWTKMPAGNAPRVLTTLSSRFVFSTVVHSMEKSGVESGAISLSTPWGGGEASFEHAKTQSSTTKKVSEYLTVRFSACMVDIMTDPKSLAPEPKFVEAIKGAFKPERKGEEQLDDAVALVVVLNTWGWYIPIRYTLGGVLYATTTKEVTEYTQAKTESTKFGGSFKAAFNGIGGGGAYANAEGEHSSTGSTAGSETATILQIGGAPGSADNYSNWADSLKKSVAWSTVTFGQMYPTLMLLLGVEPRLLSECVQRLQKYSTYPRVKDLQRHIDVGGYEKVLAQLLNPFG